MNNHKRAETALVALKAFNIAAPNGDLDEVLSDLICNLMHLCDDTALGLSHLDFDEILASAQQSYLNEHWARY